MDSEVPDNQSRGDRWAVYYSEVAFRIGEGGVLIVDFGPPYNRDGRVCLKLALTLFIGTNRFPHSLSTTSQSKTASIKSTHTLTACFVIALPPKWYALFLASEN